MTYARSVVPAALAILCATLPVAHADPRCMARMLSDVAAEEAPEEVRSKSNGAFGPIFHMKVDRGSGRLSYCGKETYCYNSNAFELTTPCRFKVDKQLTSSRFFVYSAR